MSKLEVLVDRIDLIVKECKNPNSYEYIIDEIEGLILSIMGKESNEYQKFLYVQDNYILKSNRLPRFVGILNSIRNKLQLNYAEQEIASNLKKDLKFHHLILSASISKYYDGYYSDAVDSAIKEINTRLKFLYKKYRQIEYDGIKLFTHVFNSDENTTLLIAGDNLTTQSGKDEQEGFRLLLMGIWSALRNPNAHANIEISKRQALERLILCSMIMNKIDECLLKSGLCE